MFRYLGKHYRPLLTPGPERASHNRASDKAYSVTGSVRDLRVLLLDDTYTSGARVQSAASALQLAGARVVAVVPIGRVINPGYSGESAALWKRAKERQFDFEVCCLER